MFGKPNIEKLQAKGDVAGLVKALGDKHAEVRVAAARALGRIGGEAAVPSLILALPDIDPRVHDATVEALAAIGAPARKPLLQIMDSVGLAGAGGSRSTLAAVRSGAASALGEIGGPHTVKALTRAFENEHEDHDVRVAAGEALIRRGGRSMQAVIAALRSDGLFTASVATEALKHQSELAGPALQAHVTGGSEEERTAALDALQWMHWEPEAPVDRVSNDIALGRWDDVVKVGPDAVDPLGRVVAGGEAESAREAVGALGRIGGERAIGGVIGALEHSDAGVRRAAAEALGQAGAGTAVEPLIACLHDEQWEVRAAATEALGQIGDARAAAPVAGLLGDVSSGVRMAAAQTAGRLGSAEVTDALVGALADASYPVAQAAAESLDRLSWQPADDSQRARRALAGSGSAELAELGTATAVDRLFRRMFEAPSDGPPSHDDLLALVPISALTAEIVDWAADASSYDHEYHPGWDYDAGYITLARSDTALKSLCRVKSPVTSDILHLVAEKPDVSVTMDSGCSAPWQEAVSFEDQRQQARAELHTRGDPPYDPDAYLEATGQAGEALRRSVAAEEDARHGERYRDLMERARGGSSQDKWSACEQLARDFKTPEVMAMLAADLASTQHITPSDLARFERLLASVGQGVDRRTVNDALNRVKGPWPQAAEDIRERIKKGASA